MDRRRFFQQGLAAVGTASVAGSVTSLVAGQEEPARSLADHVTIYRDNFGVPHIVGETEEATFFGYGYAQAQDHLEIMMLQYLDAQGRLSEVQGINALGNGYLFFDRSKTRCDGDYLQRLLRTKKGVVENKDKIDPQVYRILSAFAAGVNAYIAEHRAQIPGWIDFITAEDIEAEERCVYFRLYSVRDALSKLTDAPITFPGLGSNQFAISREKSANGRIIQVGHPHTPWEGWCKFYEAHLITPGKLYAGGMGWVGSPFFLWGFNDKITWSATSNGPNTADAYEEKLNPENPLQYLYEGQWRNIKVEYETFRIKGPKGMDSVTLPLYYTHHGPVVKTDKEKHRAYSVKLPNFEGVNYSTNLYGLMKSQNLQEFKAVLARHLLPRWNLLYTDSENIYYVHCGLVAQRAKGYDWRKAVPGWTKDTEWGPYLPLEAYPQLLNPPAGFLQNCNSAPWVSTKNSGLMPLDPAPYYLLHEPKPNAGEEALNLRCERLFSVLGGDKKITLDEMKELAFDNHILPADVIVPLLDQAYARNASGLTDPRIGHAIEVINAWDRRSSKESVGYTYIHFWGLSYQDLFSAEKFSRFVSYFRKEIDINSLEEQEMALAALKEGIDRIQKRFGAADVPWGKINVMVRGGIFPLDGTSLLYENLHPEYGIEQDNGQIYCNNGWGALQIVMQGEPKEIWTLLPYGTSEDPASPHYKDMAKLHSQGQFTRFWFTPQEILDHTESVWGNKDRIKSLIGKTASAAS